jgi:signal transduction histidine kinase
VLASDHTDERGLTAALGLLVGWSFVGTGLLRELARGIHPAVLTDRGLAPAVEMLASRTPVPVELAADTADDLPPPVATAIYFVVSEALTNVAKYARAWHAAVIVARNADRVVAEITDDGVGGADLAKGSGLHGLSDRVAALDGRLELDSSPGRGTRLRAEFPLYKPSADDPPTTGSVTSLSSGSRVSAVPGSGRSV